MKRVGALILIISCMVMSGCALAGQFRPELRNKALVEPPGGLLITAYDAPLTVNFHSTPVQSRVSTSTTIYIREPFFGTSWAWGNASIETAARNSGMTTVYYTDYSYVNVIGLVMVTTVRVHGN